MNFSFSFNAVIFLFAMLFACEGFCQSSTHINIDSIEVEKDSLQQEVFHNFIDSTRGLQLNMIAIKGGKFMMGSNHEVEEQPVHEVYLDDFFIGMYEVTQLQWVAIMGNNPSHYKGDSFPVEQVSWKAVQRFLEKLNSVTGKNYRLPTEAEWEYAARAGTNTLFNTGDCLSTDLANYNGNFPYKNCPKGIFRKTHLPVGSFPANEWGLYDIHGNVWEWCSDIYSEDYYAISPIENPKGAEKGNYRVIRGGGWGYFADGCRSTKRGFYGESNSFDGIGFRLVLPKN